MPTEEEVIIDNSDLDLSDAELSRPLLDKLVLCRVAECQTVKADGRRQKKILLVTEEPTTATNAREISPGFKVTYRVNLDVVGKWNQKAINDTLGRFQAAVLKLDKGERWGDDNRYVGNLVKVKFSTRPDRNNSERIYQDVASFSKAG